MKLNRIRLLAILLKINFFKFVISGLAIFVMLIILNGNIQAQGCFVVLKINDPPPISITSTADLTLETITSGSSAGLVFSYFNDPDLLHEVTDPAKVTAGTYYIKGTLNGSMATWVAGPVKVTNSEKPKMVVISQVLKNQDENIDLTAKKIKSGSDVYLLFTYWLEIEANKPIADPKWVGIGA